MRTTEVMLRMIELIGRYLGEVLAIVDRDLAVEYAKEFSQVTDET